MRRASLLLAVVACGDNLRPMGDAAPPPICHPAVQLDAGPWFTEITADVLPNGVVGNRIQLADLDGDAFPDLLIHPIGGARPMLATDPPITTWQVLMNRPGGSGRMFVDATVTSGYGDARDGTHDRAAQFASAGDFDNDGDLDLFSGYSADGVDSGDRNQLLLNDGTGHFTRVAGAIPNDGAFPWHTSSAAPLDYDRDGNLDIYVGFSSAATGSLVGQQDRLYRGAGDGTFAEVTNMVGLGTTEDGYAAGTNHRLTYGVAACDIDDDGWTDLLGMAYARDWNQLLRNDRGTFVDVARASGYAADEIEDYSDNQSYRCYCQQNPGACSPMPPAPVLACPGRGWNPGVDDQPWRLGGDTFSTACGDVDNDGDLDLYNAELVHWDTGKSADGSQLLVNQGGHFTRPGVVASGLAIPHATSSWNEGALMAAFGDFDNDGNLDIYLAASDYPGNNGLLYRGHGDGTFENASVASGVNQACANGLAVGDLDHDGDEDLIIGSGTARDCATIWSSNQVHVYRNDVGQAGNALRLRLVGGPGTNRAAIGARVLVHTTGGTTYRRDVQGTYGYEAIGRDLVLTIGLGADCVADVEVTWPDSTGTTEMFRGVEANYAVTLTQGGSIAYGAP